MRAVLWFLALFGAAAAVALFAGNNEGTVTVFWPPWRVDLSLNLVLLAAFALFVVVHVALRALSALFSLPRQARQWRLQQRERSLHAAVMESFSQLLAGRFSRARRAAQSALAQERALEANDVRLPQSRQLRVIAHLLAAEASQALLDRPARDQHLHLALRESDERGTPLNEAREGVQLRAAQWALKDQDAAGALARLEELPQGVQRRTLALRLRLKAARLDGRTADALETARLLAKHRAFSVTAAQSILRGLALESLSHAHEPAQLVRCFTSLDPAERELPEVAIQAAQRLLLLGGDLSQARNWLLPVWESFCITPQALPDSLKVRLILALEACLGAVDADWLGRIESAQRANPRDPMLQYLAGVACMRRQLWGKAQQLLTQAGLSLQDRELYRRSWEAIAQLAEGRDDRAEAAAAWKRAAQTAIRS